MNITMLQNIKNGLKTFKGSMLAFNIVALIAILAFSNISSPSANAAQHETLSPLDVCTQYAEQGTNFSQRFKSCVNVMNIQQTQSFSF